jgi:hypothetical protein
MLSRHQNDLPDDSFASFRVLNQLSEIRADQNGGPLNEAIALLLLQPALAAFGGLRGFVTDHSTTRK